MAGLDFGRFTGILYNTGKLKQKRTIMCESNAYFIKDGKEETSNGKRESCKAARPKNDAEEHFWGRACGGGKSAGNGS